MISFYYEIMCPNDIILLGNNVPIIKILFHYEVMCPHYIILLSNHAPKGYHEFQDW